MKQLVLAALLTMLCVSLFAQKGYVYPVASNKFKINSVSRIGGHTRAVLPVVVPPMCTMLYYSVSTHKKESWGSIGLSSQLMGLFSPGMSDKELLSLSLKVGNISNEVPIDVYILASPEDLRRFNNNDQKFSYIYDYSRESFTGGTISIPTSIAAAGTTIYIGLRNNSVYSAAYVDVEVSGVIGH